MTKEQARTILENHLRSYGLPVYDSIIIVVGEDNGLRIEDITFRGLLEIAYDMKITEKE